MLRVETIVLVVIAWLIATVNGGWWSAVGAGRVWGDPSNWLFIVAVFVALVALHFVLLGALANRWTVRPLLTVIIVASAATAHFMRTYAVMMDPTMIQNILKTDSHEATRAHVLVDGGVGAAVVGVAGGIRLVGAHRAPAVAEVVLPARGIHGGCARGGRVIGAAGFTRSDVADAQSARTALPDHARQLHLRAGRKPGARCAGHARSARAGGY